MARVLSVAGLVMGILGGTPDGVAAQPLNGERGYSALLGTTRDGRRALKDF